MDINCRKRLDEIVAKMRKQKESINLQAIFGTLISEGYEVTMDEIKSLDIKKKAGRPVGAKDKQERKSKSQEEISIPKVTQPTINLTKTVVNPKVTEESVVEELIQDMKKNVLEEYKNKLLRKEISQKAATEVIIDKIITSITVLPPLKINPIKVNTEMGKKEQRAVLMLSDIQAGTYIDKEATGGLNEYNRGIRKKQFEVLRDSVLSLTYKMRQTSPINVLHAHLLGDFVEGIEIFIGQAQHVDQDLYDQVFDLAQDLCKFFIEMLNMYDKIIICGVVGNHGRVGKKGENPHWVNWDLIVYKFIETTLMNYRDRIEFNFPKAWWLIDDILGYKFLMTHGDGIKSWMGLPFYGIQRADSKWMTMLQSIKEEYQYLELGHFHTPTWLPRTVGETIINGCWPGGSIFALKDLITTIRPSQMFFGVHPDHGISFRYPIWLDVSKMKDL